MHLLYIQTLFQKINITMTIYLIIQKIFIIISLPFKQLDCNPAMSFGLDIIYIDIISNLNITMTIYLIIQKIFIIIS